MLAQTRMVKKHKEEDDNNKKRKGNKLMENQIVKSRRMVMDHYSMLDDNNIGHHSIWNDRDTRQQKAIAYL